MSSFYQLQSLQSLDWDFRTNGMWDGSLPEGIRHSSDNQYVPEERTSEQKRFNQQELNDLIRDLSL